MRHRYIMYTLVRHGLAIAITLFTTACGVLSNPAAAPSIPGLEGTLAAQTLTALNAFQPVITPPGSEIQNVNPLVVVDLVATPVAAPIIPETEEAVEKPEGSARQKSALCTNRAEFVEDISIPDHTNLPAGSSFTKTWRFKNVGTCTWNAEYSLVFIWGDLMDGIERTSFGKKVPPGESIDISVDFVAPKEANAYQGNWMFEDTFGNRFGTGYQGRQFFWVAIDVGSGGGRGGVFGQIYEGCGGGG